MPFRPTGSDHAITSSSFTVSLASPLSREFLAELTSKKNPWADALPATREMRSLEVQLQTSVGTQLKHSPAVEFAFLRPNGTPTWVMRIDQTDIFVECTLYTRWAPVWNQASELLSQAMSSMSDQGSVAKCFTIQVVDKFETESPTEPAIGVFSAGAHIVPRVAGIQSFWHQHIGWLEARGDGELLQNVNVDVAPKDPTDHALGKTVSILHLQRLTYSSRRSFSSDADAERASLSTTAADMHANNKALLREMLTADLQAAIQLNEGGS